ncbi:5-oxoprolinase subunit PxpA [Microbacterium sp. SYP-A9085]|uniref:5-oxoprolinase subunit PxpA n=1 Tax=Microbacterium sp. SYP-A9085 TaxID=2664454 RepID=UPI00129B8F51|nr:5-oxoprolinase subunit PxpA [Microbacterium sp. SYP-A9085]MRH29976.1 5-oxoprolinase subunit PxpA [Microbacterium sp. SYP-A9085]
MHAIDLNADLGETVDGAPTADDEAMFAVISSASIACGGHAGDAAAMRAAAERAARTGVAVGAHPSYPDRAGFGRRAVDITPAQLHATLADQLDALSGAGAVIRYVKPHGALYHAAGVDPLQAEAVVQAVAELSDREGRPIALLAQGDALAEAAATAGLPFFREAFLDRAYLPDGTLVPRGEPGALVDAPDVVAARAVRLARGEGVEAVDGTVVPVVAASLCLHGDTPAAVQLARAVRAALEAAGIAVTAPW